MLDASLHAPALSRRLLYTALTRARRCVVVVADGRALGAALAPGRGGGGRRRTSLAGRLASEARAFSEEEEEEDGGLLSAASASADEFAA